MASLFFENQFITAILDNKITINELDNSNFEARWLKHHHGLYEWLYNYYRTNGKLPNTELVQTRYPEYTNTVTDEKPTEIIAALNRGSVRERIYKDFQQASKLLQEMQNPEDVITFLKGKLLKYDLNLSDSQDVFDLTSDEFLDAINDYTERRNAFETQGVIGIPSGLGPEFDAFINGGFYKGMLYGVIGYTGIGKSWISQLFGKAAMNSGNTPMYFALEGQPALEYYRFMTIVTEVSNAALMGGTIPIEEFNNYRRSIKEYRNSVGAGFYLATFGKRNQYTTELIHKRIVQYKPKLAIVDYAQMLQNDSSNKQWEDLLAISRDLKIIAMSEQIPLIAILQTDMSAANSDSVTNAQIGLSKGMSRDFDYTCGINKVKGMNNIIKINGAGKARFSKESDFAALYRCNWDNGKVKFEQYVTDDATGNSF